MSTDPESTRGLTPEQDYILDTFLREHLPLATSDTQSVGYYDLASANVRDGIGRFEITLDTREKFYLFMAGLSIGTVWTEGIAAQGLPVKNAGEVMRVSLAVLFPEELRGN